MSRTHGTRSCYHAGCSCAACRGANARAARERRERRATVPGRLAERPPLRGALALGAAGRESAPAPRPPSLLALADAWAARKRRATVTDLPVERPLPPWGTAGHGPRAGGAGPEPDPAPRSPWGIVLALAVPVVVVAVGAGGGLVVVGRAARERRERRERPDAWGHPGERPPRRVDRASSGGAGLEPDQVPLPPWAIALGVAVPVVVALGVAGLLVVVGPAPDSPPPRRSDGGRTAPESADRADAYAAATRRWIAGQGPPPSLTRP